MGCVEVGDANELDWRRSLAKSGFVNIVHRTITVEERSNRERVMLIIEPKAILWYRRVILYSSIGLSQAKFTHPLILGAICVRQSAYRSNYEQLFRYSRGFRREVFGTAYLAAKFVHSMAQPDLS